MDKQTEILILQLAEVMSLYDLDYQMISDMALLLPPVVGQSFLTRALGE